MLGNLLGCAELERDNEVPSWYDKRDEIKKILAEHLETGPTQKWLSLLEPADIWCAEVLSWDRLFEHEGFKVLDMIQEVTMGDGFTYETTRCPIRIDGELLTAPLGSPALGEHTKAIIHELIAD